jgi:hypothetical protein
LIFTGSHSVISQKIEFFKYEDFSLVNESTRLEDVLGIVCITPSIINLRSIQELLDLPPSYFSTGKRTYNIYLFDLVVIVWMLWRREKSVAPAGNETPILKSLGPFFSHYTDCASSAARQNS